MARAKKAVEEVTETVTTEVAEVKKTPAKKTSAKKPAKPKEPVITTVVQYGGKEIFMADIVNSIKDIEGEDIKTIEIYIKPEENAAYYIVNGDPQGKKIDM